MVRRFLSFIDDHPQFGAKPICRMQTSAVAPSSEQVNVDRVCLAAPPSSIKRITAAESDRMTDPARGQAGRVRAGGAYRRGRPFCPSRRAPTPSRLAPPRRIEHMWFPITAVTGDRWIDLHVRCTQAATVDDLRSALIERLRLGVGRAHRRRRAPGPRRAPCRCRCASRRHCADRRRPGGGRSDQDGRIRRLSLSRLTTGLWRSADAGLTYAIATTTFALAWPCSR